MIIDEKDFPINGYELYKREKDILENQVDKLYSRRFLIKKDDGYYYTCRRTAKGKRCDVFDDFNELKNYLIEYFAIVYKHNHNL